MTYREVNFDGLIGPTHNYAGLSLGNIASAKNAGAVSNPRLAALQGLAKMRAALELGLCQGFLPPLMRPDYKVLRELGFAGSDVELINGAAKKSPSLLANIYSASSMWTANAATVAPSPDTNDACVHFTPANLAGNFHRTIEAPHTAHNLKQIFADENVFVHHALLPGGVHFGDEGAANHGRLARRHGDKGLHLFVYGEEGKKFPARQRRAASEAVARNHGLEEGQCLYVQQSQAALDAGAFHNDVVGVANETVLFLHQESFEDRDGALAEIRNAMPDIEIIEAPSKDVSLEDAISSYLFNSQLLTLPTGEMALLLPQEAAENKSTHAFLERVRSENNPVNKLIFKDVRESMRNGGGPACLRLRVVLSDTELAAVNSAFILDAEKVSTLEKWVEDHYRDRLAVEDLADPDFAIEVSEATAKLYDMLGIKPLSHVA